MNINLINSKGLKNFFNDKNYKLFKPHNIVNNNDTVFISFYYCWYTTIIKGL